MRVLVVGATGRVGRRVVAALREAGHEVTALARDPTGLEGVRTVAGDVRDPATVGEALADVDAVVSALGTPPDGPVDDTLTAGVETLLAGMATSGVDRLVVVGAAGVLDAPDGGLRMDAPDFPPFLREVAERHRAVYERLRESDTDWTLVCPPGMPDAEARGARVEPDRLPPGGREATTGDVAAFAVRAITEGLTGRYGIAD